MLKRILGRRRNLSTAERRVADWISENPELVLAWPLARIARDVGVSEPTVIRFCRSLGCSGFSDFKMKMAQSLAKQDSLLHADVKKGDSAQEILAKVMGRSIRELTSVLNRLDPAIIEQAANILGRAKSLNFYGIGASGIVAEDAHNKFFRLGIPCHCYRDQPTLLQAAAIADAGYAIVAISKTGSQSAVVSAAIEARSNGARVIALTSPLSALAVASDLVIPVDIDEDTGNYTPMSSRLAQLAVLDVLQVAFALKLGSKGIQKLERSKLVLRPS
jgi:RpiR family carbohydrate utilization transcriptional regulator